MTKLIKVNVFILLGSIGFFIMSGCAPAVPKVPIYYNHQWNRNAPKTITLLPVVDVRRDKKEHVNLDRYVKDRTLSAITKKGFGSQYSKYFAPFQIGYLEQLKQLTVEQVRQLGPQSCQYILIVAVIDIRSEITFGSTGNAEVAGYLYDKALAVCRT